MATGGKCPFVRPELEALPERMADLPVDKRGYPVPFFVQWINGEPEFRAMDPLKWRRAVREKLCWVCGGKLGRYKTFVLGPMCGITRTTSEPPCHKECARWSARNCPFLARPHMVRREDEVTATAVVAGYAIKRNPGVSLLWTTDSYSLFDDGNGRPLITVGDFDSIEWWAEGKVATRAQVQNSIAGGYPILEAAAIQDGALPDLHAKVERFQECIPE